jgi:hypothetical protein
MPSLATRTIPRSVVMGLWTGMTSAERARRAKQGPWRTENEALEACGAQNWVLEGGPEGQNIVDGHMP